MVKNPQAIWETWVQSLSWEDTLEKGTAPTPVFLPGEFHEQRSLINSSSWGSKESHTSELLSTAQHKVFSKTVMQYGSSD